MHPPARFALRKERAMNTPPPTIDHVPDSALSAQEASAPPPTLDPRPVSSLPGAPPLTATASVPPLCLHIAPPGYELLDTVGEGGMGIVYRARDLAMDREVAIKILQDKYAPDSTIAARFVEEAKITGQLQHPGIPPVYHVGTLPDGRPFLAMKLIKGQTLDHLLKNQKPVAYLPIFEAICHAVGYAHAHNVIHRDLKPGNIMVGAFGEVQVMDWGLAKVLTSGAASTPRAASPNLVETLAPTKIRPGRDSESQATQAGSILGTPAFMAPEQAAGEIEKVDQRADVFGLGAILCTMLTGQPPYEGTHVAVLAAAVRGQTAEAFQRLDVCGAEPEVVALCKHCLSFAPADRPASGNALAQAVADLRTAAEERAKQAELEKAKTEVREVEQRQRRRLVWIANLVVVGILLAGIASTSWGLVWAERSRQVAEAKEHEAWLEKATVVVERDAKDKALAAERLARYQTRTALRNMLGAMIDDIAENLLARATNLTEQNKEFLRKIIQHYEHFAAPTGTDDAEIRSIRAEGYIRIGLMYYRLGELKEAEAAYAAALVIRRQLAADFPTRPEFRQELAMSYNNLGTLFQGTGRLKEAEAAYADALALQKQLVAEFRTSSYRNDMAGTFVNLARLCNQCRDFKTAKAYLEEALPHLQAALKGFSWSPSYRQSFRNNLFALVQANAGLQDQTAALQVAARLRDLGWDPPGNAYDAGCALALCIPVVEKDDKIEPAKRQAAVQFYGDEAMKMLRDAVAKGYKNVEHTKKNPDLDPLRGRPDFQKLLESLTPAQEKK
jgi:serine/threonine protein kinase